MKIWVDNVKPIKSEEYIWRDDFEDFKNLVEYYESVHDLFLLKSDYEVVEIYTIELIDINPNHKDYVKILDWLRKTSRNYTIHIH